MRETFGERLSRARKEAGLSLRALGARVGLSIPYLHDVEHGRRRVVVSRWASLVEALPGLTVDELAESALSSGPVEIDAESLTKAQRKTLVEALVQQATDLARVAA